MKKLTDSLDCLGFILRLEIGIPFVVLKMPYSLFVGILIVMMNLNAELKYRVAKNLFSKIMILSVGCILNSFISILPWAIYNSSISMADNHKINLDDQKAFAQFMIFLIVLVVMLYARMFAITVDRFPWQWIRKLRKNGNRW